MVFTIALLTDFGVEDSYVGVMKGVMRGICSKADFIDITHAIQPQNVREAALSLMGAYWYFPSGTIFLVVVDPGVGSVRRPIAVRAGEYTFVAPDNGVLTYTLRQFASFQAVGLENTDYHLATVSQTFHGRDIFAPSAAHLAAGVALAEFGAMLSDLVQLPVPLLAIEENFIVGEVIHIDHFGNIVTSIGSLSWLDEATLALQPRFGEAASSIHLLVKTATVKAGSHVVEGIHTTYSAVEPHQVLGLVGSSGFLELAVNQGDGAARLGAVVGDQVEVTW